MVSPLTSPYSLRSRLLLLLASSSPSAEGFTMFEVLVALMISFLFLTGTLNAMVVSTIFQVKAERQAQASYWIQQDLENVRADAAAFTDASNCPNVGAGYIVAGTMAAGDGIPPVTGDTPSAQITNTRKILNRTYTLTRTKNSNNNVATLTYTVGTTTAPAETLATLYTEVLPAAALSCP